jgi:uncharacterized coiled-coil DUF342 family protein
MTKSAFYFFLSVALGCLLIWMLLDKCSHPDMVDPAVRNEIIAKVDSIERVHREVDEAMKSNYAQLRSSKDSIEKKLDQVRKALESRQHTTEKVIETVKEASQNKDTIGQISACNELVDQAIALNEEVEHYKAQNDSLKNVNDSLLSVCDQRLQQQQDFNEKMRQGFEQLNKEYELQTKQFSKAQGKANRHYSVGIGGGVGITKEGRPAGMAGIFITRTLFRF